MDQSPKKSAWRWVRRIAVGVFAIFALAILAGIAFLKTRPMPSAKDLAAADERYQRARALFNNAASGATGALRHASSTTTSTVVFADPNSTAALQARADRLYRNIFEDNLGRGGFDVLAHGSDHNKVLAHLDDARALAALYDKGIRVSPELTRNYRLKHALVLAELAWNISGEPFIPSPEFKHKLDKTPAEDRIPQEMIDDSYRKIVLALKFLRVIDCPSSGFPDRDGLIAEGHSRIKDNALQPLPPELMKLDLNLLAPRQPMDWQRCVALQLDYMHDLRIGTQQLLDSGNAFQYVKFAISTQMPNNWYSNIYTNGIALYGAVVGPAMSFAPTVNSRIIGEQVFQDYATAWSSHNTQEVQESVAIEFQRMNEQIKTRVIAGAIELRRGAPIPSPDTITPDSYFFDPITQRPYKLYVSRTNTNYVQLHVRRPVAEGVRHFEMDVYQFNLPANHPGLQGVPTL